MLDSCVPGCHLAVTTIEGAAACAVWFIDTLTRAIETTSSNRINVRYVTLTLFLHFHNIKVCGIAQSSRKDWFMGPTQTYCATHRCCCHFQVDRPIQDHLLLV